VERGRLEGKSNLFDLQHVGREDALYPHSDYRITVAFHGLRRHPPARMLFKVRYIVDSNPT
jgi:hypothetical protein